MADQAVPQDSKPPPPFTYSSATQPAYGNPEQSNTTAYSQPPQTGQPNTILYTQPPQYGAQIIGQPVMAQAAYGQQIVMQNQYGQPMVVQGGMQPVGVIPMVVPLAINPNDPAQNEHSVRTKCPHCQQDISTTVHYEVGSCTWLWCILLGFMGCILCCFFPFLWKGAKDAVHTCPNCKAEVGRFIRQQRSNVRVHAGGHHHRRRRHR